MTSKTNHIYRNKECNQLAYAGQPEQFGWPPVQRLLPMPRTIAKSGGLTAEAGDGLHWAEGAGLGSQGHGHPEGKPSFQAQGVQRGVDQGGVYLTQSRTAQRVDVLIPTAVPGCPRGRLFT